MDLYCTRGHMFHATQEFFASVTTKIMLIQKRTGATSVSPSSWELDYIRDNLHSVVSSITR
jgi:hypothetical protein